MSQERSLSQPRVVVVDDDTATRVLLGELLADEGYDATLWDGQSDPLAFVRVSRPDVAIVDLHIGPALSDDSAPLHELLADDADRDVAVVLCSADAIYLRDHAGELEARGFTVVEKPFNLDDVLEAVRDAASRVVGPQGNSTGQSALSGC